MNTLLAKCIVGLNDSPLLEETQRLSAMISSLIQKTKQEHRFQQVQHRIAKEILALL